MYNVERRAQAQALHTPTQHTFISSAVAPAPRRRVLTLGIILEAFSWLGEIRAMPFAGLHSGSRPTQRRGRDH